MPVRCHEVRGLHGGGGVLPEVQPVAGPGKLGAWSAPRAYDKRSDADKHRIAILPKRWIVERTFGWHSKFRRLSKDYEFHTKNSDTMILIAANRLMLARLA